MTKITGYRTEKQIRLQTNYHHGLQSSNKSLKDGFKTLQASTHTKYFLETVPTSALLDSHQR